MNEQNFQYLKDNLKYMGFGENLNEELGSRLKDAQPEFSINYKTEIHQKPFEASLHFRRSAASDLYFLNAYTASLSRSNGQKMEQSFYLDKGRGVTAKEAYNLLEGRAVFKELSNKNGEKYGAWLQMDFKNRDKHNNYEMKQYHENYGYDLHAAVSKFAVAELQDPEKEKLLMQSLRKGNLQSITIEKDGSIHKMFIEANPQFKTVDLYNADLKRVQKENIGLYETISPTQANEKKEGQNQSEQQAKHNKKGLVDDGDKRIKKAKSKSKSTGM